MKNTVIALAFAVAAVASVSAQAAVGIFLYIPGIPGESTSVSHMNEIDVLDWSQSVANVNSMPVVLPLQFTHNVDRASPLLIGAALQGTTLELAVLTVQTQGASPLDYIVVTLNQPRVVAVRNAGSNGQDQSVEIVTLTCTTFTFRYRQPLPNGSGGPPIVVTGTCGN